MPSFRYQSVTSQGQSRSGILDARDRAEVVRELATRGETAMAVNALETNGVVTKVRASSRTAAPKPKPHTATPTAKKTAAGTSRLSFMRSARPSLSQTEMASLIRELATAIEAGLPLMQSLRTMRRQASGKAMPVILEHLIERVEAGDPLHVAAREYGPPFTDMIIGMLRAADASGKMSDVLHQLADLLERAVELRREVFGATLYPMIVAVLIIMSVIILVTVLVPKLIAPLAANSSFTMPLPTVIVLGIAEFFASYWLICISAIVVTVVASRMWIRIPANRLRFDYWMIKMPIIGPLLRDVAVARFTRTMGTLTSAGLPLLDSLRITQGTLGNKAMIAALDDVQDKVTGGKSLAEPLERSGLFPPLLIQVVGLGERSGRLENMLLHAATAFDRRVNTSVKVFTKALPPVLLIVMAAVGGFILAAILLPLLSMQEAMAG